VRFLVSTPGEVIDDISVHTEFKQRSLEMIGKSTEDAQLIIERINGFHSASHTIAFLLSIEDALGIIPDDRVQANRIIEIELERIRSHLYVLSRMVEPAGFGVPLGFLNSLKERVSRLIGKYTGHRFFFGVNGLNSVLVNFNGVHTDLLPVIDELKNVQESLVVSGIFVDRLQGNGKIRTEKSVGPVARSSGFGFDARMDSKSLPYANLGFRPVVSPEGDAHSRFIQRINEIFQSIEIIEKMETYSKIDVRFSGKNKVSPDFNGKGIARIESPAGDLTYLVEVDDGKVKKLNFLTPSEVNLPVFLESMKGGVFTDFHFNWESFGIWISELAVKIT
jgi:Ni,Fe-hydrogenase III large subunit